MSEASQELGVSSQLKEQIEALVNPATKPPICEPDDCWGFVRYCYSLAGMNLPKRIAAARHYARRLKKDEPMQLLDVIEFENFFLEPRHVGVALDQNWFIQKSDVTNGIAMLTVERFRSIIDHVYRLK